MTKWNGLSNKEIEIELKNIELEHTSVKNKMVKLFDDLTELEKEYQKGKQELNKRT